MKLAGQSAVFGAAVLIAVAPPACGGHEFDPGVPRTINQTFNIHAAGDSVSLAGGLITIIVPPNAISEDGNVTATSLSADSVPTSPLRVGSGAYRLTVSPATVQVLQPITVKVNYAQFALPVGVRGPELRINRVVSSAWQPILGGTNDSAASNVAAQVTSFGDFGILGLPVASLVVSPSTISIQVGATQPIIASPKDSLGNTLPNRAVAYTSNDVTKATVSAAGVVTGIAAGTAAITVGSETKSVQIPTAISPGSVSTNRSTVSVSASSVPSGGTAILTLQAKDTNGTNLSAGGLTVVFTATGGTSTGTIGRTTDNANGTYTAVFTGVTAGTATTIGATINDTAVTSTLPTLTVAITNAALWYEQDFSTFANTAAYRSATSSFVLNDDQGLLGLNDVTQQFIDTTVFFGSLTRSVRYDYPAGINLLDKTIRRGYPLPSPVSQVWFEVWLRFSPNFTTANAPGFPDFKGIFATFDRDGYYRFACHIGYSSGLAFNAELANIIGSVGQTSFGSAAQVWNGQWTQFRFHFAVGTLNGNNTIYRARISDQAGNLLARYDTTANLLRAVTGYSDLPLPKFKAIQLFANIDPGTLPATMSIWIGRVRAYNTDPGWGF